MDIQEAKQKVSLLEYAKANSGAQVEKVGANTYRLNPCPICGHYDHFTIYANTNSFYSHSGCPGGKEGGDIINYLQEVEGLDQAQALEKVKQLAGEGPLRTGEKQRTDQGPAAADRKEAQKKTLSLMERALKGNKSNYYYTRGLTDKTIEAYRLGYIAEGHKMGPGFTGKHLLPVSDNFCILRSEDGQYRNIGSPELLNSRYLKDPSLTGQELFITEGVFDALSLEELGRPAVALNSIANKGRLLEALQANKEGLKGKVFIIALDTDSEGKKTAGELLEGLQGLGLQAVIFDLEGYKDINEALTADREGLARQLQQLEAGLQEQLEAEKLRGTVYEYLADEFELDQEKRVREKDIKTGFKGLDNSLGGGLYPGLYVIGAITSLGKTAFALQLADNIAAGQQQALFFSLEMARYEMVCRSLTRVLFEQTANEDITTGHILRSLYQGQDIFSRQDFNQALEAYRQGPAKYLSLIEGDFNITIDSIADRARAQAARTGTRPVIFIDYLQAIQPGPGNRITDKQHIDQTVIALKRLSRDLDLPVIVVSSFNRASYGKDSADTNRVIRFMTAFKESGAIEYTADVLIAMDIRQQDGQSIEQAKAQDKRLIDLIILKNRRGKAFEEIPLTYLPKQNYFREGTF